MGKWFLILVLLGIILAITKTCSAQDQNDKPYEFFGDFRLRSEYDANRDNNLKDRFRERVRLRFGANYRVNEYLTIGARLVTGNSDDPNSPYQTMGTIFNKAPFNLDRAHVTFRLKDIPLWLIGGKFPHPFQTPAVYTELVWDADVHPEGVAAGYTFNWSDNKVGIIAADYILLEKNSDTDALTTAGQVFIEIPNESFTILAVLGGYRYYNMKKDAAVFQDNAGNAGTAQFTSDFAVIDAFFNFILRREVWPIVFNIQFIKNVEANIEEDTGFAVGAVLGQTTSPGDFKIYYQFQLVEQDAVFSPFAQDDFLAQTNFKGHVFGLTYRLLKKTDVNLWGLLSKLDTPGGGNLQTRFRADLTVSF